MTGLIRNYIFRGGDAFLTNNDCYGVLYVEAFFKMVTKTLNANISFEYADNEVADALIILGFFVAQYPGKMNTFIPRVLEASWTAVTANKSELVQDCLIHNLGYCFWNNTLVSLEWLHSKGLLSMVIKSWVEKHSRALTYRVRKGSALGLLSLFSLSIPQLKQVRWQFKKAEIQIDKIYKTLVDDLPTLLSHQEMILSGDFESNSDEYSAEDEGLSDDEEDETILKKPKNKTGKATNEELDKKIDQITSKIEKIKLTPDQTMAREALDNIENQVFNDRTDEINEIFLFETTLKSKQRLTKT